MYSKSILLVLRFSGVFILNNIPVHFAYMLYYFRYVSIFIANLIALQLKGIEKGKAHFLMYTLLTWFCSY